LIPVFFVKSDGVNLAMSCICPFATIATLIVLPVLLPDAADTNNADTTTAAAAARATVRVLRLRAPPYRASCMVLASS
jgi:hypothetical protein